MHFQGLEYKSNKTCIKHNHKIVHPLLDKSGQMVLVWKLMK